MKRQFGCLSLLVVLMNIVLADVPSLTPTLQATKLSCTYSTDITKAIAIQPIPNAKNSYASGMCPSGMALYAVQQYNNGTNVVLQTVYCAPVIINCQPS